jgi:iron complex transport system permease protein
MSVSSARAERRRLAAGLGVLSLAGLLAGMAAGGDGWSPSATWSLWRGDGGALVLWQVRAPRTLGAWLAGALLGLAGAIAQGLFRNPLADPYLLGSASGAVLGVVLVLAAGVGAGGLVIAASHAWLVAAAFVGALLGVTLTLALARGARDATRLLLAGIVVGVLLGALGDMATHLAPQALRGKQAFLLGSTSLLGWTACAWMAAGLLLALPLAWRLSRALDALVLGEEGARSLGIDLPRVSAALVAVLALATGLAVSQAGLVAFVGLVAPHVVRRFAPSAHRFSLLASAAAGGVLLLLADVLARSLTAPNELPVGILTAVVGGGYLLWLLRRRRGGA